MKLTKKDLVFLGFFIGSIIGVLLVYIYVFIVYGYWIR